MVKKNKTYKKKYINSKKNKSIKNKKDFMKRMNISDNTLCVNNYMGEKEDIFSLGICKGSVNGKVDTNINTISKGKGKGKKRRAIKGGAGIEPSTCNASSIPGPFVGSPYNGGNSATLPSGNGVSGSSNYYDLNNYKNDIQLQMQNGGGKRRRKTVKRKRNQRGGSSSIIPESISYRIGSFYNTMFGYPQTPNPSPYINQLPNTYFKPSAVY